MNSNDSKWHPEVLSPGGHDALDALISQPCMRGFYLAVQQKYPDANYNMVHLFKSLTYFAEADKEQMPNMLILLEWERVKQFFIKETPRLASYF